MSSAWEVIDVKENRLGAPMLTTYRAVFDGVVLYLVKGNGFAALHSVPPATEDPTPSSCGCRCTPKPSEED